MAMLSGTNASRKKDTGEPSEASDVNVVNADTQFGAARTKSEAAIRAETTGVDRRGGWGIAHALGV